MIDQKPDYYIPYNDYLMENAFQETRRITELIMIKGFLLSFIHRFKFEDNYRLSKLEKMFYLFKLTICFFLGLWWTKRAYPEKIESALVYYGEWYGGWDSTTMNVGYGIFKNWFCRIEQDGDCYL